MTNEYKHISVLLNECIDGLNIKKDGIYLDLTIGRAGHSKEILKRLSSGQLIGFDQDDQAIKESEINLKPIGSNFTLIHQNFVNFRKELDERNIEYVDGILMDLGVSSPQFDDPNRGFSYKIDAPLDMRMDRSQKNSAFDIVNTYPINELIRIFKDYGEEKYAYSIAKNIIKAREISPIKTTLQLVEIIKKSKPSKELKKIGHPAKQVFQAIRIEVNDELNVLSKTLHEAIKSLKPNGGRLAVISFHSGEDKIVKSIFKEYSITEGDRIDGPIKTIEKEYQLVNKKPILPSENEILSNHRSKSAKLRIIERK